MPQYPLTYSYVRYFLTAQLIFLRGINIIALGEKKGGINSLCQK